MISDHAERNYLFERYVREKIKHSDNADEILKGFTTTALENKQNFMEYLQSIK